MSAILNPLTNPEDLHSAVNRLADHFSHLAGFHQGPSSPAGTGIELPSGTAISPHDAASCLRDVRRSTAFLQGIHQALRDLLDSRQNRPIHILYAGCGPFAALITPLLHRFGPGELRLTLLDIQPDCVASASRLIDTLGHGEFVERCTVADAATWKNDTGHPFQLLITETMQAALAKECQVSIAAHLSAMLDSGGILIPESVRLDAVLLDPAREFSIARMSQDAAPIRLGTAFELNLESAAGINRDHGPDFSERTPVPCSTLRLPPEIPPAHELWITTTITTYGEARIHSHESGLTIPRPAESSPHPRGGDTLSFRYILGPRPRLQAVPPPLD